jgi:hypothetical protein
MTCVDRLKTGQLSQKTTVFTPRVTETAAETWGMFCFEGRIGMCLECGSKVIQKACFCFVQLSMKCLDRGETQKKKTTWDLPYITLLYIMRVKDETE